MLNFIWPLIIIISIVYGIIFGNVEKMNIGIFESLDNTIKLMLTFLGNICFWNGIMNILKYSNLLNKIIKLINPIMKILFPNVKKNSEEYKYISMNLTSNLLGLGNASTPMGLKAIKKMQEKNTNKDKLSDDMCMLIVLNTASIQIIPTTVLAIRKNLNAENITKILIPVWISTILAGIAGIITVKIIIKVTKRKG